MLDYWDLGALVFLHKIAVLLLLHPLLKKKVELKFTDLCYIKNFWQTFLMNQYDQKTWFVSNIFALCFL